jgi:hypothetical protein
VLVGPEQIAVPGFHHSARDQAFAVLITILSSRSPLPACTIRQESAIERATRLRCVHGLAEYEQSETAAQV